MCFHFVKTKACCVAACLVPVQVLHPLLLLAVRPLVVLLLGLHVDEVIPVGVPFPAGLFKEGEDAALLFRLEILVAASLEYKNRL